MQFSENWLREWVDPKITTQELVEQLTMAGLEVDAVEAVAGKFTQVVVGQIKSCKQHPDADKLRVCSVNAGGELLQIVCGASNAREGIKVPVALPGGFLPGNVKIKKVKLRGVESSGMLCAEAELGLAEKSDGLFELPSQAPVGTDIREYLGLDDNIIEVDLTPNRGDCLSILGVAREVATLNAMVLKEPEDVVVSPQSDRQFSVTVKSVQDNPRYLGQVIEGVDMSADTPLWMVEKLRRGGIRSIDPVVDVTNYVLLELGQPLHGFDLDQLSGGIVVRKANKNEKLVLLDNTELELDADSLVIADEKQALALAGIMGGASSGVSSETTNIFLECAWFNPLTLAGKARAYGMHTDASHRFERGVDPELARRALNRSVALLVEITGGKAGPVVDITSSQHIPKPATITLRAAKIRKILGFSIDAKEITRILNSLGCEVQESEGSWQVTSGSWRFDMEVEEDLIEELARIYGYNQLPTQMPLLQFSFDADDEAVSPVSRLRNTLVGANYQEVINYSFVDPQWQKALHPDIDAVALTNPIASDMSVMRTSLLTGLLKTAHYNLNRQHKKIKIFETGLIFTTSANDMEQVNVLGGLCCGPAFEEQWNHDSRQTDYYDIKGDVEKLINLTKNADDFLFVPSKLQFLHPGKAADITVAGEIIGFVGSVHPQITSSFGIKEEIFVFQLLTSSILQGSVPEYVNISKFPEVRRDLSFLLSKKYSAREIVSEVKNVAGNQLSEIKIFDIYQGGKIEKEQFSLGLGLTFTDASRTLMDNEIAETCDAVVNQLKQRFNAILRE